MSRCAGLLVAVVSVATALSGINTAAQSQGAREEAQRHIAAAKQAAGYEVSDLFDHLCSRLLIGSTLPFGRIVPPDNDRDPKRFHTEPVKVFDNLYYVGGKIHSAWALKTSQGFILIDTIYPYNSEELIVGGMRRLGLDASDIKYVIISHAHGDHIGGAEMLQNRGQRILMDPRDWDLVEQFPNRYLTMAPKRDLEAEDGQPAGADRGHHSAR